MVLFLGVVFLAIYACAFAVRKNPDVQLNVKVSLLIKKIHYTALFFCVIALVLYSTSKLRFYGLWTIPIFTIITFFTGVFYRFFSGNVYANKADKIYFTVFSRLPFLSLLMILFPFAGIVIFASLFGKLMVPEGVYYQDSRIIVQSDFHGVLDIRRFKILKREGLFNKVITTERTELSTDSINVRYDKNLARIYFYEIGEEGKLVVSDTLQINIDKNEL